MKPIIIVCGLLGTGKTTLSKKLEKYLQSYYRFNTDELRKELGIKKFDRNDTPMVNDIMYEKARKMIEENKGVIFDSPYRNRLVRQKVYEIAKYYNNPLLVIECTCPENVAKERMRNRIKGVLHDATTNPEVYDEYKKIFESIKLDLDDIKNDFISFIRIDTHESKKEELRVNHEYREFVNHLYELLDIK